MKLKKIDDISDIQNEIIEAEKKYNYQSDLTQKLDNLTDDFTDKTLLEIVLWKTNRYPKITTEVIILINDLRKNYSEQKARELLRKLLNKEMKGFDLPMASTVLRFAVPTEFQIIDQRVYRLIMEQDTLKIPYNIDKKIELYFDYLSQLKKTCQQLKISFPLADRILYKIDKEHNKNYNLNNY